MTQYGCSIVHDRLLVLHLPGRNQKQRLQALEAAVVNSASMNNIFPVTPTSPRGSEIVVDLGDINNQESLSEDLSLELPTDPFFNTLATITETTASTAQTALHCAIAKDKESMVRLLIDHGADVMRPDGHGKTALHLAAEHGSEGLMRLVIRASPAVDPNVTDYLGRTPLFSAVQFGNEAAAKVLLTMVDVNRKDGMGTTALHLAAECGFEAIARLLLANGADVHT